LKHLICHLFPAKQHGTWRRTVQHILARRELFDGLKLVSIAVDHSTDLPREAVSAFRRHGFDCQIVDNDVGLGEGASFGGMLEHVTKFPGETFYCHAKGSTHAPDAPSQRWADLMFHLCLDYPDRTSAILHDNPIAGPCRRIEKRMGVDWHYSGTFFWFRNQELAQPKTQDRNCVERWPAENFAVGADLGLADCRNLYDEINWRSWITGRFRKEILWDASRKADRVKREGLLETAFEPLGVIYAE
jgi:hypothetical protein